MKHQETAKDGEGWESRQLGQGPGRAGGDGQQRDAMRGFARKSASNASHSKPKNRAQDSIITVRLQ